MEDEKGGLNYEELRVCQMGQRTGSMKRDYLWSFPTYLKWYLVQKYDERGRYDQRGLGLGVGKHWVGCHGCWEGSWGRACLVVSLGKREWLDSILLWKFPLVIVTSVNFLRDHWSLGLREKDSSTDPETNHFSLTGKCIYAGGS